MTRNVGITLTDLAYQVYQGIPHGLRSRIISEFLTQNAKQLTSLESPYKRINGRIYLKKTNPRDKILETLRREF